MCTLSLICLVLSCRVVSCLVLSCLVLSCLVCLVLFVLPCVSYVLTWSYDVLSFRVFSCVMVYCLMFSCLVASRLGFSCVVLCRVLFCCAVMQCSVVLCPGLVLVLSRSCLGFVSVLSFRGLCSISLSLSLFLLIGSSTNSPCSRSNNLIFWSPGLSLTMAIGKFPILNFRKSLYCGKPPS